MRDPRHRPVSTRLTRRDALLLGAGAFVALAIPAARRRPTLFRRRVPLMGTIADLAVVSDHEGRAHVAMDAAVSALRDVDRLMSRFRADSDVGRANLGAARDAVAISAATRSVLEDALTYAQATDGAFDPCLGGAAELWDVNRRTTLPDARDVRRFAGRRLYRQLELGDWRGAAAVRFHDDDIRLDLGGIAKGFGVDQAVRALREHGVTQGLVNVGGDLYALGRSEDGDPWRVGVRSPTDPNSIDRELDVEDRAVATSGDYEQGFEVGGRWYGHLLDARSGAPPVLVARSQTVVADTCMEADRVATARCVG